MVKDITSCKSYTIIIFPFLLNYLAVKCTKLHCHSVLFRTVYVSLKSCPLSLTIYITIYLSFAHFIFLLLIYSQTTVVIFQQSYNNLRKLFPFSRLWKVDIWCADTNETPLWSLNWFDRVVVISTQILIHLLSVTCPTRSVRISNISKAPCDDFISIGNFRVNC